VAGQRHSALHGLLMLEPIATLKPSVHLVSKLGLRAHWQPLDHPTDEPAGRASGSRHLHRPHRAPPAQPVLGGGDRAVPLSNLLIYGGAGG
jgi:hypothetical protein